MGLNVEVFDPACGSLGDIVECYWYVTAEDFRKPLVHIPDGRQEIIIDLVKRTITTSFGNIYPRHQAVSRKIKLLIIRFYPCALTYLTRQLLSIRSYNNIEQLSRYAESEYPPMLNKIFVAGAILKKIAFFEAKIASMLKRNSFIPPLVQNMIENIQCHGGCQRLTQIYNHYSVGERQLQVLFKTWVGMTPKKFSKIVRLSNVRAAKSFGDKISLTSVCYEHGYSDQSHLIKDFKEISGLTPLTYIKRRAQVKYNYSSRMRIND